MRFVLITSGSRGDVQPLVALGVALRDAGHAVRLVTHEPFRALATAAGVEFAPVGGDVRAMLASPEGQELLRHGTNPIRFLRQMGRLTRPVAETFLRDAVRACRGADRLVCWSSIAFGGETLGEQLGVPVAYACPQPVVPTGEYPTLFSPYPLWFLNRLSHHLALQTFYWALRPSLNHARRVVLGLPPRPWLFSWSRFSRNRLFLLAYSGLVVPRPRDWTRRHVVTGFWRLPAGAWQPPPGLQRFLDAGPPPVCVGFGSMAEGDPEQRTRSVCAALHAAGVRGVLLGGWGGIQPPAPTADLYFLNEAPHDWLFPRMAAVVHHGGAGTTGAALHAGVPSVITPFLGDQPFWAGRLRRLGVGVSLTRKFTPEALTAAIRQALTMRDRARQVQATLEPDGAARAVRALLSDEGGGTRAV